jgi:hypothetical protein
VMRIPICYHEFSVSHFQVGGRTAAIADQGSLALKWAAAGMWVLSSSRMESMIGALKWLLLGASVTALAQGHLARARDAIALRQGGRASDAQRIPLPAFRGTPAWG